MFHLIPTGSNRDYAMLFMFMMSTGSVISTDAQAGNYYKGQTIYATYCQGCHGSNGKGELSGTPNFTRGLALMKPDARLFETVINGKNAMPGFQGVLKNEDIYDVISYIRNFY